MDGLHDKPPETKDCGSARQLSGIGNQQHWGIGMVVAQPIRGTRGVLQGGAGTGITGDPGRRNALALKGVSSADASPHTYIIGNTTMLNSSSESRGGFGYQRPGPKQHHNSGRVLRGCGIR